jgi:DNA-binding YbaB/EbfC family protein
MLELLMGRARKMQEELVAAQARLEAVEIDGSAGAGLVRVTMTGKGDIRSFKIDPSLLRDGDAGVIEDLLVTACQDARVRVDALLKTEMGSITSRYDLPAG